MARRSSARLRNRNSSTPKRASLSHDAAIQTPRTAPVKLSALHENDEMPGAFPGSASPPAQFITQSTKAVTSTATVHFNDATPKNATPIKPSEEEMYPKQHRQNTAKPLDEARWLGFTDMGALTEPPKRASKIATLQQTPTRASNASNGVKSPKLQFTFRREQSLELSPEAKKLMDEKREEAAKIREQMIATGEGPIAVFEAVGRKVAAPKSKKGRFSDTHMEQFKKMDSIASHASSFRTGPNRDIKVNTASRVEGSAKKDQQNMATPSKSLKRKQSPADLDEPDHPPSPITPGAAKPAGTLPISHLPRSASSKDLQEQPHRDTLSPAKRMKHNPTGDVSTTRPASSDGEGPLPSTPRQKATLEAQSLYPDLSSVASPTQASLARAASTKSIKASKIPGPLLTRSPSKATLQNSKCDSPKQSTPLLARSPEKVSLFGDAHVKEAKSMMSPLLMRSPSKPVISMKSSRVDDRQASKAREAPLLARSPLKMSVTKDSTSQLDEAGNTSATPLLARSPAKITILDDNGKHSSLTPINLPGSSLMGRFNLLRSSPMKSILRSPQRLYSDDPAKVAAGTHLATPPKFGADHTKASEPPVLATATAPVEKHVDFSTSTKARYERAQRELSSTPSKGPTPPLKFEANPMPSPKPAFAQYPDLQSEGDGANVAPNKRRQTAVPGDFTFRAGEHSIIFGQSPNAPTSAAISSRLSTIRHVSAEPMLPAAPPPAIGSKKRKFEFENATAVGEDVSGATSDKENIEEERPAKRAKTSAPSPAPVKQASRPPTLGVKRKKNRKEEKDRKPSTISRARLNALAQPKRRD